MKTVFRPPLMVMVDLALSLAIAVAPTRVITARQSNMRVTGAFLVILSPPCFRLAEVKLKLGTSMPAVFIPTVVAPGSLSKLKRYTTTNGASLTNRAGKRTVWSLPRS
jgi:hypothetical protein